MTDKNVVDISSNTQVIKLYNKKGRALRVLCLIFSILFLLGGGAMVAYYALLGTLNYNNLTDETQKPVTPGVTAPTVGEMVSGSTQLTVGDGQLLQDSKVLNVMLFGEDNNHGDKYGRTDTMIMMSIDNWHKKLKLTSFQRDTYVYIPGYGMDSINCAYTYGGPKLTIQTIEANFGIKIDRYAVVDFKSFISIIDTLGGVDIEITEDEIEYINYQMYKNHQVKDRHTIKDPAGVVHLNGQEALWYARNRGLNKGEDGNEIGLDGDDWDRTSRQRKLLETLFNSMKGADLGQIISIVSQVGPLITTNLKKDEITSLVMRSLTYLSYDVVQNYVPTEGLWYYNKPGDESWERAGSCIIIADMDAQRMKLAQLIYEDRLSGGKAEPATKATEAATKAPETTKKP